MTYTIPEQQIPKYTRLGRLQPEEFREEGGFGMITKEVYTCGSCYAVVSFDDIPSHTLWHRPHTIVTVNYDQHNGTPFPFWLLLIPVFIVLFTIIASQVLHG